MDDFFTVLNSSLDEQLATIKSLTAEVAALEETSYGLYVSLAAQSALSIPALTNAAREAEAVVKEVEAQLLSHANSLSSTSLEVKMTNQENGGEGSSGDIVIMNPDCTVDANAGNEVHVDNE